MLFRVLGPLAVEPETGPLVLAGSRTRALLTALLLDPGKLVPVWRGPAYGEFADGFACAAASGRPNRGGGKCGRHHCRTPPARTPGRPRHAGALTAARRTPEALATYQLHCDHLRDELGLDPSRALRDLHARVLRSELDPIDAAVPHASPSAKPRPAPAQARLPARPSPLVGRREALASLGTTLATRPLVTLVGTGWVGKTRTAMHQPHGRRAVTTEAESLSPYQSTVCTHHVDADPADEPLRCRPWGKRRFMIRCVVSGSTLMFRPVGRTRNGPVSTANTACALTRWFRRRCSGHRVQEMALPRTTTVGRGHTLRVGQQPTGNQRAGCGDREQPFPRKPTRGKRRDTP